MKARLRGDLVDLVPESERGSRLDYFAKTNAGRSLEILNVTSGTIELSLPRVEWAHGSALNIAFGIERISIPQDWLEEKVSWSAWDADRKRAKA